MRFIHTGDWHIGAGRSYIPNALDRTLNALDGVYKLAVSRGIDTVAVAGDVFDSPNVTVEERQQLLDKLFAYDRAGIGTLMIPGNHDFQNKLESAIRSYSHLSACNKFYSSVITETTQLVFRHGVGFLLFCEPWKNLKGFLETLMGGSVAHPFTKLVVISHETVRGSVTTTGMKLPKGTEVEEAPEHVTYVAFGDIHKYQRVCAGAFYAGSPLQINFGEPDEQGVLIVDTDDPDNPEFIRIPSIPLVTVSSISDIPDGSYARLVYDKKPTEASALPETVIATKWEPASVDLTNIVHDESLLSGLEEILKRRGLDAEAIPVAIAEAEEIFRSMGE